MADDYMKDLMEKAKKKTDKKSEKPEEIIEKKVETEVEPVAIPQKKEDITVEKLDKVAKKEIETYGTVKIFKVPDSTLLYYKIPVPRPTAAEKAIIRTIKEAATRLISIAPYKVRDPQERRNLYYQKIMEILRSNPDLKIPEGRYEFYAESVVREMVGYGIIDPLIKDDKLEEIMVIGPNQPVYIFHRDYDMMLTNIEFYSDNEIQDLINRIARQVGRRVDISSPLLDARLPDGSRVNATIPPASVEGSTLTIRKFREDPFSVVDLIQSGTLDDYSASFLWFCVEGMRVKPANIIVSGGTGSGKTTTLNVLSSFIPASERIITIEDTVELNLPLKHWIRLEARPPGLEGTGELSLDVLTKNSLRMRPDRVIVGEIRHDEAFTLFTAMNTGHSGSMGTVHANSAQETIARVTSPPMNVPEIMLSGLNFIIVEQRIHDKQKGTIRRITEISEVSGALEKKPIATPIFLWNASNDKLERTRESSKYLEDLMILSGLNEKQVEEEIHKRAELLLSLQKKKIRTMKNVSDACQKFLAEE